MLITPLSRYPVHRSSSGKTWTSGRLAIYNRASATHCYRETISPQLSADTRSQRSREQEAETMAPDYDARVLTGCAGPGKELLADFAW